MMTNLLLDITSATIDWSRAQFALTAIYHWLFVPLTLGLAGFYGDNFQMPAFILVYDEGRGEKRLSRVDNEPVRLVYGI